VLRELKHLTMEDISSYPKTDRLVRKLAERFNVPTTNILIGTGSEQLIKLITQTFLDPRDRVLIERGSFGLFTKESLLANATVSFFTLARPPKSKARLGFIANPKTPTGELITQKTIKTMRQRLTPGILVVDEANGELIDETSIPDAIRSSNMLVLRTLSKAFGLAGLRIGFVIGPTVLLNILQEAQQPFAVSQIAIRLGAAALTDTRFIKKTRSFITRERLFLQTELRSRGLTVSDSVTNNLFILSPQTDKIILELTKRGVSVINGTFFPGMQTPGFRISLKDRKTNRLFLKKLDESLACINKK
ncbi:MAG: histidinol-phosphate transaminase, partial [bacterium]|nr:histidinol-phosphate transaminase [bacterium]